MATILYQDGGPAIITGLGLKKPYTTDIAGRTDLTMAEDKKASPLKLLLLIIGW